MRTSILHLTDSTQLRILIKISIPYSLWRKLTGLFKYYLNYVVNCTQFDYSCKITDQPIIIVFSILGCIIPLPIFFHEQQPYISRNLSGHFFFSNFPPQIILFKTFSPSSKFIKYSKVGHNEPVFVLFTVGSPKMYQMCWNFY